MKTIKIKDFIKEGDHLFIGKLYGNDKISNEEYDKIVECWKILKTRIEGK